MRIAYIAPYKGPTLVERRPVVKNLSVSNTIKIELIAQLLRSRSHEVDLMSPGEVIELNGQLYSAFYEPRPFHPQISIYYSSVLPIRFVNGFWSSMSLLRFFKARHRTSPYDIVIIFNLKRPHITCANYAIRILGLPVVLEYEDDSFVNVAGQTGSGFLTKFHDEACTGVLRKISGAIGVSPHLLSQLPPAIPKLLLRGVVGDDVAKASEETNGARKNWVLFSGTHIHSNGVRELIEAWGAAQIPDWELHITGHGQLTEELKQRAAGIPGIVFHGLVSRGQLVCLLSSAKIGINPHAVSKTPGNVFAFKIIEYLGAGAHVITTPMGTLEKEVEAGITYMPDNSPATIAATIQQVVKMRKWVRTAAPSVLAAYGTVAVADSLDALLQRVVKRSAMNSC
jgi:glycosyltransferase involved in cell wall biosynthesis